MENLVVSKGGVAKKESQRVDHSDESQKIRRG
jgi:hypothetical protein